MENVALSKEEAEYFQTGGETLPPVIEAPQQDTPAIADAPVVEAEQEGDGQARDEKGRFVDYRALHQERQERKKAEAELTTIRERQAILEDRWNTLLKVQEKPVEEKGPPNPDEDIFGTIKWLQEQTLADRKAREDEQRQQQEYQQRTRAEQEIVSHWQSSMQEYKAREPDFENAATWLSEYRHKELEGLAFMDPSMANPAARNAQIDADLKQVIALAREKGINPAEAVHQIARSKGYGAQAQSDPNQAAVDNLSKLEKAQQASRTLSASGGKSPGDNMTAEGIANMSNEEFTRFMSDPANERVLRNVMGG